MDAIKVEIAVLVRQFQIGFRSGYKRQQEFRILGLPAIAEEIGSMDLLSKTPPIGVLTSFVYGCGPAGK